ncbi:hypothetical protein NRIC_01930 [Enterococcus florum]|uniref:SGNH hydrolase-type esterase domain-containing protein n=1 Tax=Enterococcus florum TaxID=2480627 RepID=A0A4P5P9Z1_9ENTE|nr:GDSL-type esterase/lipase family protein [Enterococcus florum]GCF92302.1 hypothetical protein NRIC_01930 [Enterococcus florum]
MSWVTIWSHAHRGFLSYGKTSGEIQLRFRPLTKARHIRLVFANEYGCAPLTISDVSFSSGNQKVELSSFYVQPGEIYSTEELMVEAENEIWQINFFAEQAVSGYGFTDSDFCGHPEKKGTINFCPGLLAIEADITAGNCILALGDSLTEGGAWTAPLQQRLRDEDWYLVNQGINGAQLLKNSSDRVTQDPREFFYGYAALTRLKNCLKSHRSVKVVILSMGINDLVFSSSTFANLQRGVEAIFTECDAHGIRLFVSTLTPFTGYPDVTPSKEATRLKINQWIQQRFGEQALDFAAPVSKNGVLKKEMDSGDHLHFNAIGGRAIVELINIESLKGG